MASESTAASGGIGFGGLLAVLFIGLKLGGVINWSWLWVLAPIWGPIALVAVIFAVALLISILVGGR